MRHLPDSLVIGPQKAGTTWIYEYLKSREDICLPIGVKETFFFDRYYSRGLDWYSKHFKPSGGHILCMEVAPSYFHKPEAAARIYHELGKIILISTLRDPVKRSFSHYLHLLRRGKTRLSFRSAIEKHPEIVDGSRYAFHLNRWQKIFGAGSIKILFQENLATEPDIYARQLCNYLNISYKQIPQILFKKINEAALPFSSILAYIGIHFADFIRYLGWYKIIHLAKGLGLKEVFFGRPGQNLLPQMSNEDHRWLMEELRPDILRLQEMLDTDLSHWLANKY
jgi:hypothetical protein